MSKNVLF